MNLVHSEQCITCVLRVAVWSSQSFIWHSTAIIIDLLYRCRLRRRLCCTTWYVYFTLFFLLYL